MVLFTLFGGVWVSFIWFIFGPGEASIFEISDQGDLAVSNQFYYASSLGGACGFILYFHSKGSLSMLPE